MSNTKNLIQYYYEAFNSLNFNKFFDLLTDDVIHDINQGERQIGKAAFRTFMSNMDHSYNETVKDLIVMVNDDGTRAAAEFTIQGTYKVSADGLPKARNQNYSLACGAFFAIKDGKIARVTNFYNLQDWIKQVEQYK